MNELIHVLSIVLGLIVSIVLPIVVLIILVIGIGVVVRVLLVVLGKIRLLLGVLSVCVVSCLATVGEGARDSFTQEEVATGVIDTARSVVIVTLD